MPYGTGGAARARRFRRDEESERSSFMLRRRFLKSLPRLRPPVSAICLSYSHGRPWRNNEVGWLPPNPSSPARGPTIRSAPEGIHPGRVVWVRDANATSWDGVNGPLVDDAYTNQKVVNAMTSRLLQNLTGSKNDKQALGRAVPEFQRDPQAGEVRISSRGENRDQGQLQPGPVPVWGTVAPAPGRGARGGGPSRGPQTACPALTRSSPW